MNINRTTSGGALPRVLAPRGQADLTVDGRRGVSTPRVDRPSTPAAPAAPVVAQVTSSPKLQALLSAAETQALRDAFAAPSTSAAAPSSVYGLRGVRAASSGVSLGGLMDLTA
jgi:hypothetical protein